MVKVTDFVHTASILNWIYLRPNLTQKPPEWTCLPRVLQMQSGNEQRRLLRKWWVSRNSESCTVRGIHYRASRDWRKGLWSPNPGAFRAAEEYGVVFSAVNSGSFRKLHSSNCNCCPIRRVIIPQRWVRNSMQLPLFCVTLSKVEKKGWKTAPGTIGTIQTTGQIGINDSSVGNVGVVTFRLQCLFQYYFYTIAIMKMKFILIYGYCQLQLDFRNFSQMWWASYEFFAPHSQSPILWYKIMH